MEIPERVLNRVRANVKANGGGPYYEVRGKNECWPACTGEAGGRPGKKYGNVGWGSKAPERGQTTLHRVVYVAFHGPVPEGCDDVAHTCGNSRCANPAHLVAKSHADNNRDMLTHGTHTNTNKTHCVRGHPLSGDNVVYRKDGKYGRQCRACIKLLRDPSTPRRAWKRRSG